MERFLLAGGSPSAPGRPRLRIFGSILLLGLLGLLVALLGTPAPEIAVTNASGLEVARVEARVGDLAFPLGKLAASDSARVPLGLRGAGPLSVRVRFEDGREHAVDAGYFAPGMRDRPRIAILGPDSVAVRVE